MPYHRSVRRREEHEKVRPLAPEEGVEPAVSPRPQPTLWLAPAVASIVLLVTVIVFGAGSADAPTPTLPEPGMVSADAAEMTVTTTTLPPRLEDMLPVDTERLSAVSRSPEPRAVLWAPSERFAHSYSLQIELESAAFDATGDNVAFVDQQSTLSAGPMPGTAAPEIDDMVTAARFHPSTPAQLAYTAARPEAGLVELLRVDVTAGILGSVSPQLVTELPAGSRLLTWGDWGYAIGIDATATVLILGPSGAVERAASGFAHAAGGDAILIDARSPGIEKRLELGSLAPEVVELGEPGARIVDSAFAPIWDLPGAAAESLNVVISPDGLRVANTVFTDSGETSVTIRDRADATLRTLRLDTLAQPIEFVADGDILAMEDGTTGHLVFVDWRTGAHQRVEGLRGDFLAVDL